MSERGEYKTEESKRLKTESSNRILPIPNELLLVLETETDRTGYVVKNINGEPMKPHCLTQDFNRLLQRKGLRHIRFHDLRHTCASLLLSAGASMKDVQTIMGHSNFSTTADIYSHVDLAGKTKALDKLNKLLL